MKLYRRLTLFTTLVFLAGLTAPSAYAVQQVTTNVQLPMTLDASVTTFDCENSPGPWIEFEGGITTAGISAQLIFRNNINMDVHTRVEEIETVVGVSAEETIRIPKQPSHSFEGGEGTGVGGNPWISVQLLDSDGNPLSGEVLLGRCVQGAFAPLVDFQSTIVAQAILEVIDCTNNPGPFIYVDGSMTFQPGLKARFFFRNQRTDGAPHEASAIVDVNLVSNGFSLQFPKQPVQGGVGGNPWISVAFADGSGQPLGSETLLGRCVQLLPGN